MTDLSQYIGNFNANDVPPDEYEIINPGTYAATVTDTEIKDNGDKVGLIVKLQIIGSQYDGRTVSDYLNIKHPNEKAETISRRRLADYALAINVPALTNTNDLVGKKLNIEIDIQQPKEGETYVDKYGVEKSSQPQNRIKKVMAMSGSAPANKPPQTPVANNDQPEQAQSGARPWAK